MATGEAVKVTATEEVLWEKSLAIIIDELSIIDVLYTSAPPTRFFTDDYTPRLYSQIGLDWIGRNDMTSIILRHYPKLKPALHRSRNAFAPWGATHSGASAGWRWIGAASARY